MSHYYKFDPSIGSARQEIMYDFNGEKLKFITDLGVFSKERIDFGTNVLLNAIKDEDLNNKKILDAGCGYGVIGLCIAKAYSSSSVHLIDVNERALELSLENSKINKISNVKIYQSNVYENVNEMFDVIITNPPIRAGKDVVHSIVIGGYGHLNQGGNIYVVIQKKQGAPSLLKEMETVFNNVEVIFKKNGYSIIKASRN